MKTILKFYLILIGFSWFGLIPLTLPAQKHALASAFHCWNGTWLLSESKNAETIEKWTQKKNRFPSGSSFQINSTTQDTTLLEVLKIIPKGKDLFYSAQVTNQNKGKPVLFKLSHQDSTSFRFKNLKHDYPQIIHYQFIGSDYMNVTLSAWQNGAPTKEYQLKFKRISSAQNPN